MQIRVSRWRVRNKLQEERELDELEIRERVSKYHQENVSMMLTWVGIEDELAAHLCDYKNVLADLSNPSAENWPLVRAALLHISQSDSLSLDHNRWLGEEIFTGFDEKGKDYLYYLTPDTRQDRPAPLLHLQEKFPITHEITPREATNYYSRTTLAVLVRRKDPEQAIALLEESDSVFDPRVRYFHPGEEHGFSLERDMDRLPILYERVGRFEDALKYRAVSFSHFGWGEHPADIAIRRLNGWLDQLTESGSAREVTRCLDTIYEWLDKANDADGHQRDDLAECPATTRQFWAWYYGQAHCGKAHIEIFASRRDRGRRVGQLLARRRSTLRRRSGTLGPVPSAGPDILQLVRSGICQPNNDRIRPTRDKTLECPSTPASESPEQPLLGHTRGIR